MDIQKILVIDDDSAIALLLERVLTADGYHVTVARNGQEALASVARDKPDLILTDLDMPLMNGYEVCWLIKQEPATRLVPILMITGQSAQEARLRAWDLGADDFLTKPFDLFEVRARCRSLLRVKRLTDELDSAEAVVFAFARAVEAKCRYTWGHSERVTAYALALGRHIGLSESDLIVLRKGAMIHDIGKINIPDAILNKPGSLTGAEYDVVKQHPVQGVRIVESLRSIRDTIPLIRWHHERPDGKGYPDGIAGNEIPLLTRVLSVADVYDALSSERPYRAALSHATCVLFLRESAAGGGLDPELVRCFCDENVLPFDGSRSVPISKVQPLVETASP